MPSIPNLLSSYIILLLHYPDWDRADADGVSEEAQRGCRREEGLGGGCEEVANGWRIILCITFRF